MRTYSYICRSSARQATTYSREETVRIIECACIIAHFGMYIRYVCSADVWNVFGTS